jgi:hypothetical protein
VFFLIANDSRGAGWSDVIEKNTEFATVVENNYCTHNPLKKAKLFLLFSALYYHQPPMVYNTVIRKLTTPIVLVVR